MWLEEECQKIQDEFLYEPLTQYTISALNARVTDINRRLEAENADIRMAINISSTDVDIYAVKHEQKDLFCKC